MTSGTEINGDSRSAALFRGRMALEALKSREEAALFHAAHAELQVALLEAESGDHNLLQRWFEKHRSISLEKVEHVSLGKLESLEKLGQQLSEQAVQKPIEFSISLVDTATASVRPTDEPTSPWPTMIEGAKRRAHATISEDLEISQKATENPVSNEDRIDPDLSQESSSNVEIPTEPVHLEIPIPKAMQETLTQVKPTNSESKKWTWLSSSVIGSMVVHVIALILGSTYMIHLARTSEPRAIIASSVETETISMEAPMEITPSDAPTADPSESQTPAIPSFSEVVSASSSSVELPSSMTGLITNDTASPTDNAIQQATSSSTSNSVSNSVQFFGVKAAGNTFCYVVDVSPSMKKDNAFAAAKAELVRSLSLLKPKQRFYISFFGGEIERLKLSSLEEELYPVYATPENLQKALIWIDRVRVQEKGLPPNDALKEAIKMDPDGIFLLFDGDTRVDVAAYLRKVNRSDDLISGDTPSVPIHTIGFYTQEFESLMKRIAQENSGVYRFVPKPMKPK